MGFEPAFIWSFKLLLLASGTVALLSSFVMRGSASKAESMVFMSMVILGLSAWPLAVTMLSGHGASLAAVLPLAASLLCQLRGAYITGSVAE